MTTVHPAWLPDEAFAAVARRGVGLVLPDAATPPGAGPGDAEVLATLRDEVAALGLHDGPTGLRLEKVARRRRRRPA